MTGNEQPGTPGARERILRATIALLNDRGLARATTKEIARAAGYSEATLYKHFADKTALLLAAIHASQPWLGEELARLDERCGAGDVEDTLRAVSAAAVAFYRQGAPVLGSLFADMGMLAEHREGVRRQGAGPFAVNRKIADYLAAEQHLDRIAADVDPAAAADLLVGACFQRGYLEAFLGDAVPFGPLEEFVDVLVAGLRLRP